MRTLAKSMLSYSWAMSLFWAKQAADVVVPTSDKPFEKATGGFDSVTCATVDQFGSTLKAAFNAGDTMQRGFTDLAFAMMNPASWDPGRLMKMSAETVQQSAKAAQEAGQAVASGLRQ
jgi:hypothetical protein